MNKQSLVEQAIELVEEDNNQGICIKCHEVQDCIEPDAEHCKCDSCGEFEVFGAEQIILMFG